MLLFASFHVPQLNLLTTTSWKETTFLQIQLNMIRWFFAGFHTQEHMWGLGIYFSNFYFSTFFRILMNNFSLSETSELHMSDSMESLFFPPGTENDVRKSFFFLITRVVSCEGGREGKWSNFSNSRPTTKPSFFIYSRKIQPYSRWNFH